MTDWRHIPDAPEKVKYHKGYDPTDPPLDATAYPAYICPVCDEWVEILPATNKADLNCPFCHEHLRLDEDAEFRDGLWRDLSKLVTVGSHWDEK